MSALTAPRASASLFADDTAPECPGPCYLSPTVSAAAQRQIPGGERKRPPGREEEGQRLSPWSELNHNSHSQHRSSAWRFQHCKGKGELDSSQLSLPGLSKTGSERSPDSSQVTQQVHGKHPESKPRPAPPHYHTLTGPTQISLSKNHERHWGGPADISHRPWR